MLGMIAALALAGPFDVTWDKDPPPLETLRGAVVSRVLPSGPRPEVILSWSRIDVRTAKGEPMTLWQVRVDDHRPLPPVGATCDFDYRVDRLGSSAGPGLDPERPWPMVETFTCR